MRKFVIFFDEKEGTSPLVRLLSKFEQISIVHQVGDRGWEPFDSHNCGRMPLWNLKRCLDIVFGNDAVDVEQLNQIYTATARLPLEEFDRNRVVGFKMRFKRARIVMIDILKRNDVVVFMAVRQDVFRWGLSKYHGDGTGNPGHLQFKLSDGTISRGDIGKIHIDCKRLEKIISKCERAHARKRRLMNSFKRAGIQTYPLFYEEYLSNKHQYFDRLFGFLGLEISREEIDAAIEKGEYFKKVHSNDIATFVENHEEVTEKFGNRFVAW